MKNILIIDDELGTRESLKAVFYKDFNATACKNATEGLKAIEASLPDVILLDVMLPDMSGLEFLNKVNRQYPSIPVIMVSAISSVPQVVEAIQHGAFDYVTKPFDVDNIRHMVSRALENATLKNKIEILKEEMTHVFPVDGMVGSSPGFQIALSALKKAAKTDSTVLICGQSGTGKELAARMLHDHSSRKDQPFVPVHCAGLPEALMESELFGHEKGAFTNAHKQ